MAPAPTAIPRMSQTPITRKYRPRPSLCKGGVANDGLVHQGTDEHVRVVAWNIRQGGGAVRTPQIGLHALSLRPHLVILQEFRASRGAMLRAQFADAGLTHQHTSETGDSNGMLLASERGPSFLIPPPPGVPARRWLGAWFEEWDVGVLGVHVPDDTRPGDKSLFLHGLLGVARGWGSRPLLVAGDLNTARRGPDGPGRYGGEELLGVLWSLGYRDCWRQFNPESRESTWRGHDGSEGRIDAAWASPAAATRVRGVSHDHAGRELGLSDHSAVVVDLTCSRPAKGVPARAGLF
ncbi:MAG: hypothetical protein DYG92_06130 [Leptolyngbya sp. PLA1]|nr:hypothetical protein [Leptolyngbya sp. PLA1]